MIVRTLETQIAQESWYSFKSKQGIEKWMGVQVGVLQDQERSTGGEPVIRREATKP